MPSLITLFLFIGPVVNVLVSALVTRVLMARGYRMLGFVSGLSISVIFLGLGQFFIAQDYRSFTNENGHCTTCCELCGLTFISWWVLWGMGFVICLAIGAGYAKKFLDIPQQSVPQRLKIYFTGGVFCIVFCITGISWARDYAELSNVRSNIVKVENSISTGDINNIGSIMLSQSMQDWAFGNTDEVKEIQISPNRKWFSLQYDHRLEVWQMPDIVLKKTFDSDSFFWDSANAFSPDGSRLAVWLDGDILVYSMANDSMNLLWKIEGKNYYITDLGFSIDGRELVLVSQKQDYHIDVFNAASGDFVYTVTMPVQNGFSQNKLSYDSNYVITGNDQVVQIYERRSGQLIHELEQVQSGIFLPNNDILFWDCDQANGKVWDMGTGNERPFEIDYGCQSPLESIAFSSDSRLFIYADLHDMLVWDLQNEKQVSHVFMRSAISEIAVTPDQQIIIIATADGRLNFLANLEPSN